MPKNYTRWTRRGNSSEMKADILGSRIDIECAPETRTTRLGLSSASTTVTILLDPDEARMIGVRLIESEALSDGDAIRVMPGQ